MTYSITANETFNSTEITFTEKPAEAIREALKSLGFRWHKVRGLWYGYQDAETVRKALEGVDMGEDIAEAKEAIKKAQKASKAAKINLDGLGENRPSLYGAELAKAIREDLKRRGVDGCTVRANRSGYTTSITVTIKASEADFVSLEELKERYPFGFFRCDAERGFYDGSKWVYNLHEMSEAEQLDEYNKHLNYLLTNVRGFAIYHHERKDCNELTTAFYNKCLAVFRIADQWNYDNSDIMTDYFDVGYYLDIDIKQPEGFTPRENMTEAEKAAYQAEKDAEAAEEERWLAEYQRQQIEAEEAAAAYQAQRAADREKIAAAVTVQDLPEAEQLYLSGLVGGIGKECNLAELAEEIESNPHTAEAVITRRVDFDSEEAFELFGLYLLDDFDFLAGKGGTASEDIRLDGVDFYQLNEEQRESVKTFMCDCVGFYVHGVLKAVSNPEGYNYSRYTYRPTEATTATAAAEELDRQRKDSEGKPAFYFPKPIEEQAAALKIGQSVTIYQGDGWILNNIYGGAGVVLDVSVGTWAQYSGVYITLADGRKVNKVFMRDHKDALVYDGILPALPDSLTRRYISDNMYEVLNASELFPLILDYYGAQGKQPIIDTIQR